MALKEIAVNGATLKINPNTIGGNANITSSPSTVEKANDLGIYSGTINVQVTGTQQGSCVQGAAANGTIAPTSINEASGGKPIRKGDVSSSITIDGTDSGTGGSCSYSCTVEIDSAGQTDVTSD